MRPAFVAIAVVLSVGALGPSAAQAATIPVNVPVFVSAPFEDKPQDLSLIVSATDEAGLSPAQPGFAGASSNGQCRVYLNKMIRVAAAELYDAAFVHLDAVVHASGGIEELVAHPEKIPTAHIWGDVGTPWRCIAGAIYNVQIAGYPTVGFVSRSVESEAALVAPAGMAVPAISVPLGETHVVYINLPIPVRPGTRRDAEPAKNRIVLTSQNQILWDGQLVTVAALQSNIQQALNLNPELGVEFEPEADVTYDFSAKVINIISKLQVAELDFSGSEKHCAFDRVEHAGHSGHRDCPGG